MSEHELQPLLAMNSQELVWFLEQLTGRTYANDSALHFRSLVWGRFEGLRWVSSDELRDIAETVWSECHAQRDDDEERQSVRRPGRPRKADAKSNAQRQADHRARKAAQGVRALELTPDQIRLVLDALEWDRGTTSDPVTREQLDELRRRFRHALALSPTRT